MRIPSGLACALFAGSLLAATAVAAENRTFILASYSDGYGIDRCLATREACGKAAANSYCRAQAYLQAVTFRKVARRDIGDAARGEGLACRGGNCGDVIAIECTR
jgi:hypothetical protein